MVFCVFMLNVLVVDFIVNFVKFVSYDEICVVMKEVLEGEFKGIMGYIEDVVVFNDFFGDVCILVFDVIVGIVFIDIFVKFVFWYDNEWGYLNKVLDFVVYIFK